MKVRIIAPILTAFALLLGFSPQLASAQAYPGITIVGTAGQGVNLRERPTTDSPIVGRLPEGSKPDIVCYQRGQDIGGTDLWFRTASGGYYTSYYDTVPLASQGNLEGIYGIHACDKTLIMTPTVAQQLDAWQVAPYNRQAAASFALANAQGMQPIQFPSCTWFASQVLWAGGLPQTAEWNGNGYRGLAMLPGTVSATAAPNLVEYLESHQVATRVSMSFEGNRVPEARIGDLVAYDWDGNDSIDHLAVVVGIAPGQYPEVSEWGTIHPPDYTANYPKRGWTWSANSNRWLQQEYPEVAATLIRIK